MIHISEAITVSGFVLVQNAKEGSQEASQPTHSSDTGRRT